MGRKDGTIALILLAGFKFSNSGGCRTRLHISSSSLATMHKTPSVAILSSHFDSRSGTHVHARICFERCSSAAPECGVSPIIDPP